jgi:hypothetical protein
MRWIMSRSDIRSYMSRLRDQSGPTTCKTVQSAAECPTGRHLLFLFSVVPRLVQQHWTKRPGRNRTNRAKTLR